MFIHLFQLREISTEEERHISLSFEINTNNGIFEPPKINPIKFYYAGKSGFVGSYINYKSQDYLILILSKKN